VGLPLKSWGASPRHPTREAQPTRGGNRITGLARVAFEGARQSLWDACDRLNDIPEADPIRRELLDLIRAMRAVGKESPMREALEARARAAGEVA